ncbi:hypothetical protein ACNTMW_02585 [Planosporangium sp. 12N6]|uniref:hypothetical protein n=1 Tax=Planosporangium spinosum TaxID=3402278 RepID=UPI003CF95598
MRVLLVHPSVLPYPELFRWLDPLGLERRLGLNHLSQEVVNRRHLGVAALTRTAGVLTRRHDAGPGDRREWYVHTRPADRNGSGA